jgi:hypothetical protein
MHKHIALILAQIWLLLGFALSAAAQTSSDTQLPDTSFFPYLHGKRLSDIKEYRIYTEVLVRESEELYNFKTPGHREMFLRFYEIQNADSTTNPQLPYSHHRFATKTEYEQWTGVDVAYAIQLKKQRMKVVRFRYNTGKVANLILEASVVHTMLLGLIPERIFGKPDENQVYFVGRYVKMDRGWELDFPNRLICGPSGQMNWDVLATQAEAQANLLEQLQTNQKGPLKTLAKDSVNVAFEGVPVRALKVTYEVSTAHPDKPATFSNLIVYYVAAPVRGRWVSCVLSYFEVQTTDGQLPWLLQQFMTFPK